MKTVTNGNNVKIHYKGTLTSGEVFDDSRSRGKTMAVLVGKGNLLKGFESALVGMTEGQTKNISLTADEAYGPPNPQAIITAPRAAFPENFVFENGLKVTGRGANGQPSYATIISFTDDNVTLDHNHPLAGKDINFEIEMVEIEETSQTETNTTE